MSPHKDKPAQVRSSRGQEGAMERLKASLPDPLPKGVSIVYDKAFDAYVVRTSSRKATSAMLAALWADRIR